MRAWRPFFFENSKVPTILSRFAPIEIGAITLGPFVFSRGVMGEQTKRHETIHFQQYLETLFVGFLLIYIYDYFRGRIKGNTGRLAYLSIRAEVEAWTNHHDEDYLLRRKRFAWLKRV